jgi:hypothetical protein
MKSLISSKNRKIFKSINYFSNTMGRKSRSKLERTTSPEIVDTGRRRLVGLGIGALGIGAVGGTGLLFHSRDPPQTKDSLEDMISPYGRVVYEHNPGAENTLYVIGQTHKYEDREVTREVGESQLTVLRMIEAIGKFESGFPLIMNEGLSAELDHGDYGGIYRVTRERMSYAPELLRVATDQDIVDFIIKTGNPIDAASLLVAGHGVNGQGYENPELNRQHSEVRRRISSYGPVFAEQIQRVENGQEPTTPLSMVREELDELSRMDGYFLDRRSLSLLQNSPQVIARELDSGGIDSSKGVAIIGNGHLNAIERFVRNGRAIIPGFTPQIFTDFGSLPNIDRRLNLSNYRIVILQSHNYTN